MAEWCEISLLISSMLNLPYSGVADRCQHTVFHFLSTSLHPSFLVAEGEGKCGESAKARRERVRASERAHVYNRTHAWLIARLSNTDCDDRWSDRLHLILSPRMRSLVLQHPSMHCRRDERAMPPHGVGWAACPWVGAENSPNTDIGLKWWSLLLSWKGSTPSSSPLCFFSPLLFLQVFFCQAIMYLFSIYIASSFMLILLPWLLNQCLKCVSRV